MTILYVSVSFMFLFQLIKFFVLLLHNLHEIANQTLIWKDCILFCVVQSTLTGAFFHITYRSNLTCKSTTTIVEISMIRFNTILLNTSSAILVKRTLTRTLVARPSRTPFFRALSDIVVSFRSLHPHLHLQSVSQCSAVATCGESVIY